MEPGDAVHVGLGEDDVGCCADIADSRARVEP